MSRPYVAFSRSLQFLLKRAVHQKEICGTHQGVDLQCAILLQRLIVMKKPGYECSSIYLSISIFMGEVRAYFLQIFQTFVLPESMLCP